MERSKLFEKCMHELDLTVAIFREQNREGDFQEFRKRLADIGRAGKGRLMLDVMIDLRLYVDTLNIQYIESIKNPPGRLTHNSKKLFDLYMSICGDKQRDPSYTPTSDEQKLLDKVKTVDENNIKIAADLEMTIFQMIANKNNITLI